VTAARTHVENALTEARLYIFDHEIQVRSGGV
jgi:hypothetical protein